MWILIFTTFLESVFFGLQIYVLTFPNPGGYCQYIYRLPDINFIPTCEGVIALFMSLNMTTLLIYWYFCCIAYEYYFIACNDVNLKEYERKTIAKEIKKKKKKEALKKEVELRNSLMDAADISFDIE